ncbi:MAG TPA: ATP-binding protein [Chitinophagaceae bacterium]|nr:ATP-binding protein [Chitinophagaceae bacterium]
MKALRQVLISSFLFFSANTFAQQDGILFLTAGKLDSLSFSVDIEQSYFEHAHPESLSNVNWKYHAGDDPQWKSPTFDDSNWKLLNTDFNPDSIQKGEWKGIGWFRLKIIIDSSLRNKALSLVLTHFGASEVYFDGYLLNRYGLPSSNPNEEKTFRPLNLQPITLPLSDHNEYLLAVRYSFHDAERIIDRYMKGAFFNYDNPGYAGFKVHFASSRESIDLFGKSLKNNLLYVTITFTTLFLIGCFHISLYLFYARDRSNFFLAILNFTVACFIFADWLPSYTNLGLRSAMLNNLIVWISWNFWVPVLILAYYSVFYRKLPWFAWLYFIGVIIMVIDWISPIHFYFKIHNWLMYIAWVDMVRIFIRSVMRKERHVWIVAIGVLLSQTAWILYQTPISIVRSIDNISVYIIALAVPVSLLMFNALRTARTTINLENQLAEVLRLSELSNQQELEKQKILTAQKETLEQQVKERTTELIHSLESLRSTQEQLIHAEKMASMGELTAGIAHEIQNPLNFINNFSEINRELIADMKNELANDSKIEAIAILDNIEGNEEKISDHGQRADAIVKSMLLHSRSSSGQKELTDINALADEYLTLAYHGMRAKDKSFSATMKTDFDPKAGKISLIPQEISRVLLNLLNNAFYELSEKKKIMSADYEPTVTITTKKTVGKIQISIKDNGRGIPEKIRSKIFQPFFTTKPSGKGAGLGLSLSYDIVKAHGGELTVDAKEGEYAAFTLVLPA